MIKCPTCSTAHPNNTLYCSECGQLLVGGSTSTLPSVQETAQPGDSAAASRPNAGSGSLTPAGVDLTISHRGHRIEFNLEKDVLLGRTDPQRGMYPDLDLTSYDGLDMGVSRQHARLTRTAGIVTIQDLGSANGTFCNGRRLLPNQLQALQDGDELRLGKLVIVVHFRAS